MIVTGKPLPLLWHEDGTELDVWRIDDGIGLTLGNPQGRSYAGCQISYEDWKKLVAHIERQFNDKSAVD